MNAEMKISVAMATYNGEKYIQEQLQSILSQTVPVNEIVLSDDCSTDNTLALATTILDQSGIEVKIIKHDRNQGVKNNFSEAIAETTGDVIFLADQDDIWIPTKVSQLIQYFPHKDLVHTDALLVDATGTSLNVSLLDTLGATSWERHNLMDGNSLAVLLCRNLVTGATVAVNGNFARASLPIPDGWIHDEWLAMLAAINNSLQLVPDQLIKYRQHSNNVIGAHKRTLAYYWTRVSTKDSADDLRRLQRAQNLYERIMTTNSTPEVQRALHSAYNHQIARSRLPKNRILRLKPVLQEVANSHYQHYSRGILTVVRDLLAK